MKRRYLILLIIVTLIIGILVGAYLLGIGQAMMMKDYDLWNCVYNNAERNSFNQHPVMIQRIQDECVCFRENNYTNLLEADC